MEESSFRHHAFANRFLRSRGFAERAFETAGSVFLSVGSVMAIATLWDDPEQMAVPLLLAAIGCYSILGFMYLAGILAELSYMRERFLKEEVDIDG